MVLVERGGACPIPEQVEHGMALRVIVLVGAEAVVRASRRRVVQPDPEVTVVVEMVVVDEYVGGRSAVDSEAGLQVVPHVVARDRVADIRCRTGHEDAAVVPLRLDAGCCTS